MRAIKRNLRRPHDEVDTEGTWAISYGDMVTLLLSFFVLYFTVDHKADQAENLQESLLMSLKSISSVEGESSNSSVRLHIGEEKSTEVDQRVLEKLGAQVHKVGSRIVVEFPGVSFFDSGKIEVKSIGQLSLSEFAKIYLPYAGKYKLGVWAFTDTRKVLHGVNKRFTDNLELSALRSVAAMRVLQKQGLPLHFMKISGFGEFEISKEDLLKAGIDWSNKDPRDLARKVVLVVEPAIYGGGGS